MDDAEERKLRVLFVDDDPMILYSIQRLLADRRDRWRIAFASDGPTALKMASEAPFDVVVTDLEMPDMSGDELLRQIRLRRAATRGLILSGDATAERAAHLIAEGFHVLEKPCSAETLIAGIEPSRAAYPCTGGEYENAASA